MVLVSAIFLAACTPQGPITGTEEQKEEKLAQIIASGGSAACTITNLTDNSVVELIVSGKKMKISGNDYGQGKKGTMINDTLYLYTWQEGETTGFKMKNPTEEEIKEGSEKAKQFEQDYDTETTANMYDDQTKFKTDCSNRPVSASVFVPPTNVKFIDPSELNQMSPEDLQRLYPSQE